MMLALVFGWLFLGPTMRITSIVLGGIGFGLFLDEVGKFVTKDNDYFYGPSAEIMYLLVVLILIIARVVRDFRAPTVAEALANAASIAADGVAHGLPKRRRQQAHEFLSFAGDRGADSTVITTIATMLDASVDTPDRLMALRHRGAALIPGFLRSPWWANFFGWMLALSSLLTVVIGALGWALRNRDLGEVEIYLEISRNEKAAWILFVSGIITAALALPAMIARRRTTKLWPMRSLRLAALVFTMSNALVDFALEGFGALWNLAVGLSALAVISYHLNLAAAQATGSAQRDELRL